MTANPDFGRARWLRQRLQARTAPALAAFNLARIQFRTPRGAHPAADTDPVTLHIPGAGQVERHLTVTDVSLPLVSFRYTYRFLADGEAVTSDSTPRTRDEVESSLAASGYLLRDVREAPDCPGREFVFTPSVAEAMTTIRAADGPQGSRLPACRW